MRSFNPKFMALCLTMGLASFAAQSYAQDKAEQCADHGKNKATHANHHQQPCTDLPKDMSSWKEPMAISAAKTGAELSQSVVVINKAVQATLFPTKTVQFVVAPEERGGSVSFAGMVQFDVPTQGTYRVITNSRPWIEMVKDGKSIASIKHQHGAQCLGMEKILDFPLSPGRHTMEFTANGKETIKFIIVPAPVSTVSTPK